MPGSITATTAAAEAQKSTSASDGDGYEWKTHSDHDYNWKQHNSDHGETTMPAKKTNKKAPAAKKKNTPPPNKSSTPKPYTERSEPQQKLLKHQAAALLMWLETQGLTKSAAKLAKGLEKDLQDVELPTKDDIKGTWKFIKADDYDTSSSEEESSSSEEESSSSEEESSSGEYESSSEEEESSEEEDTKAKAKAKAKAKTAKKVTPTRSNTFNVKKDKAPQRGVRRIVSFNCDKPTVHMIPSKPTGEEKKRLFYDRAEIKQMRKDDERMKQEEQAEAMQRAMKEASESMGIILPGVKL